MADPYNPLSTFTYRQEYMTSRMQEILKSAVVGEKICRVNRSDTESLQNPYGSTPTATVSGLTGTYSISNFSTTNDTLQITEEVKIAEHIYDFQSILSNYDLWAERMDAHLYSVALATDIYVLNMLCEAGTAAYTTPAGGFTTASNILTILANLGSKLAGKADLYKGRFIVVEAADTVGFTLAGATNGYSFADNVLNNGFMTNFMGWDVYVVADSTFTTVSSADSTSGTQTWSNSGHRVAGVKGVATYGAPRGIVYDEKKVSGKTGMEIETHGYIGFKLWAQKAALIIDITVTA
jgi:hypothetical protein